MLRLNLKKELFKSNMTHILRDIFIVYTDGACRNNGKASANSSIGIYFSNRNLHKIENISEVLKLSKHTNNIAELTAINKSLTLIKQNDIKLPIHLYTDSEYCINCITKYCESWENKGWKKKGGEIKNLDLIKRVWELYNNHNDIIFEHIRSHTGKTDFKSKGNEIADKLANKFSNI